MATFKHIGNTIHIDDVQVPLEVFLFLEPSYRPAAGLETLIYKDGSLRVRANGLTTFIDGWPAGERFISRKEDFRTLLRLTHKEDTEVAKEVDSIARPEVCREREYPAIRDLVVALWKHVVEGKDSVESGVEGLQRQRVSVKNKYPLKENTDGTSKIEGLAETVLPSGTG